METVQYSNSEEQGSDVITILREVIKTRVLYEWIEQDVLSTREALEKGPVFLTVLLTKGLLSNLDVHFVPSLNHLV